MKSLDTCANGCGIPPALPSKVICKACQERITRNLEEIGRRLDEKAKFIK